MRGALSQSGPQKKPFYPPLHQKVKKTLQLAFQATLSSSQLQIPSPSLPNSPFFCGCVLHLGVMVVNLDAGSAVGRSIAFFEEETGTAKVKSTLEKMLDDTKAREEELQSLPSIKSRIAFFEAARRQHKDGEEKQIQTHQENLMGGVAEVSLDYRNRRLNATILIQRHIKRWMAQRKFKEQHKAALALQTDYRNRRMNATILIQRHIKRWMAQRKFKEQHKAALALQTAIRGCLARRNYDARRKFVVRRSLQSYLEEELEQERCALAKNVGSSVEVKNGKQSSFKKLKACFESCKNHNKPQLHEMKATNEKHGRTEPKGWKRWWELRFSGCFVPKGRKFDDRCKGSIQFQSAIGCCLVRNHCTVLEEMEVAKRKETDVCHDSSVNLD